MELRIFRTWEYTTIYDGMIGGTPRYQLTHTDKLQYRLIAGHGNWADIPIVESEKPQHPEEIKRQKEMDEMSNVIKKSIAEGRLKLPNFDLSKIE